jgi:hypothetical protein
MPIVVGFISVAPLGLWDFTSPPWHFDAVSGRGDHPISFAARTAPLERHSPSKLGSYSKTLTIALPKIGLVNNPARHRNRV